MIEMCSQGADNAPVTGKTLLEGGRVNLISSLVRGLKQLVVTSFFQLSVCKVELNINHILR
jgi:hypothetical protein